MQAYIPPSFFSTRLAFNGPTMKALEDGLVGPAHWLDYIHRSSANLGFVLACDWSHGVPQLFWKVNYINYPLEVCSQVDLYAEYIYEEDD